MLLFHRSHRFTSQVVSTSPVSALRESMSWMPMASSSSRMRSASLQSLAERAAERAAISRPTVDLSIEEVERQIKTWSRYQDEE